MSNPVMNSEKSEGDQKIVTLRNEACEALVSLGYSNADAYRIIRQITISEDTSLEQIIKEALKKMI